MPTPANRRPGVDASIVQATIVRGYDAPAGAVPPQTVGDLVISTGLDQSTLAVSQVLFSNRTDGEWPLFVLAPGSDLGLAPRFAVHAGNLGDPNLVVTAAAGSLYVSNNPPGLWQNQDGATTWLAISDVLGGENLEETLAIGNFTGGQELVVSNGSRIIGESNGGGSGFAATIQGGSATGGVGAGGKTVILGGSSVAGDTGNVELFTLAPLATATSGSIQVATAATTLGGDSGGVLVSTGNVGAAGIAGDAGSILVQGGRSFTTGLLATAGHIEALGGPATPNGQGGHVRVEAGSSTAAFVPPVFPASFAGRGGTLFLTSGSSSGAQSGADVTITAGGGGSGGAVGGNVLLNPGKGGGGFADGQAIANGILRSSNIKRGSGDPNGVVAGDEGDVYQRIDAGLGQLWLNTNGSTTGWVRLAFAGDFIESFEQLQWGVLTPAAKNPGAVPADEYADVGLWKGLTLNTSVGTVTRGAALPNGPVLSFTTANVGDWAALDMSLGAGSPPHAIEHRFAALFQARNSGVTNFRTFMGFSTADANNTLAAVNCSPGAPEEYLGFVADPAQFGNWRVLTANGVAVTGPLDTGVSVISTQTTTTAWFFVIDTSLYPASVQFLIYDPDLALQSSITVPTTLPNSNTRLQLNVGSRGTVAAAARSLDLQHATLVNLKGIVGAGGGTGLAGLTLAQVLLNGNETGPTAIRVNQGSFIQGVTDDNVGDGADVLVLSGTTTLAGNDTGLMTVGSGNRFGVGGAGETGNVTITSGFQFDAAASGNTGILSLISGGHAGTGGRTGDIVLASGQHAGTGGTIGDILIAPGTFTPNPATPGNVSIKGGSTNLVAVNAGNVTILSGENSSANGNTGLLTLQTSNVSQNGDSGIIALQTGTGGVVSGGSGNLTLTTGNAIADSTGSVLVTTGDAGNGGAGQISLACGAATVGVGSPVVLTAGNTVAVGQTGGRIILNPGVGPAGNGVVFVNGKLTVTGLIDPTGLLLDGQAVAPTGVGAAEGLLWVDSTAVPSRLIFVDDTNTPHDISTGGGATTLAALTDVTIAGPLAGETLTYNGVDWQNLPGAGGSPLTTILAIGNTTGNLPIVVSNQPLARIVGEADLTLDPGGAPGDQVVIDGIRWPVTDGLLGYVLTTDGAGNLSFQPGGGGAENFAEAFARMQWGAANAVLIGAPPLSADGIFTSTAAFNTAASTSGTQGVVANAATLAVVNSDAGLEVLSSTLQRASRFLSVVHFDIGPVVSNLRFFAGATTGTVTGGSGQNIPAPVFQHYVGVELRTDAIPPQATFHFVTDAATGVPTTIDTGVIPSVSTGFWLTIDTTLPAEVTLTLYDQDHVALATTTFAANLPLGTSQLNHIVAIRSLDGLIKTCNLWSVSAVTRADLFAGVGGGGGNQDLASVLGFGNETNGIALQGNDNGGGSGGDLELLGGTSTGGLGSGGGINLTTGAPDPAGNGDGGDIVLALADGAGTGTGGSLDVTTGGGGAINGDGGDFSVSNGNGVGSGNGGVISLTAGDGGITSGFPGAILLRAGDATGGNRAGARINLTSGNGAGTEAGGPIEINAGDGGITNGDGGDIVLTPGTAGGAGIEGEVRVVGDAHVTGKLTVDGLIDPTGLLLNAQGGIPFTPLGNDGGIWVNAGGGLVYSNALGDLNLSTAIGGGPTFLDALMLAGYGFLAPGNSLSGPLSYGVYGSSVDSFVSPGPPPASITWGTDVEGPLLSLSVGAAASSLAWLSTADAIVRRDQRYRALFKFQITSPAQTDQRLFIGFTDDPTTQVTADDPANEYLGLREDLAGLNVEFVGRGSGGAMVPVLAMPADALVHYLVIDCTDVGGSVTFTILASDGATVEAVHTEPTSLLIPGVGTDTYPFVGIFSAAGTTPRGVDFYFSSLVTRADLVSTVTGGGGGVIPQLESVLSAGSFTGANDILISLTAPTGIVAESALPNTSTAGKTLGILSGAGSAEAGTAGAGGVGGALVMTAGDGGTTDAAAALGGAGGNFSIGAGDGGSNTGGFHGGVGGAVALVSGAGGAATIGVNNGGAGGNLTYIAGAGGSSFGGTGGNGGSISLMAGAGGAGPADGSGGTLLFQAGDSANGVAGTVQISGGVGATSGTVGLSVPNSTNGPGSQLTLRSGNAGGVGGNGGRISLTTGNALVAGSGGVLSITTGTGAGAAAGGSFVANLGAGGVGGAGGAFQITAGNGGVGGNGGALQFVAGAGNGVGVGGNVSFTTGAGGAGGANGGIFSIATGVGLGATGAGGNCNVTLGNGSGTGAGGSIVASCGDGGVTNATGGSCIVQAGVGTGSADGGGVQFTGGESGTTTGNGGPIQLTAGDANAASSGNGGALTLTAGSSTLGNGGNLILTAGSGVATGEVVIAPQFNNDAEAIKFGVTASVGAGPFPVAFVTPFTVVPRCIQLTLETVTNSVVMIQPGTITANGFTATVTVPLAAGSSLHWTALR